MKINYSPQQNEYLAYKFDNEVIFIKDLNAVKKIDFTNFSNGKMNEPIDFILSAEKVDGELTVTLIQPVDSSGNPIEQEDFDTTEYEEVQGAWKTIEEIEAEKNAPKPPTPEERIEMLENMVLLMMMEG